MARKGWGKPAHVRVLNKVEYVGDCWLYTGATGKTGYARITLPPGDSKVSIAVHRAVYQALVGPIPEGMELDHLCKNRNCVNPNHLEVVTHTENVRRGFWGKNDCIHGHVYDEENTRWYFSKPVQRWVRFCRTCSRERER